MSHGKIWPSIVAGLIVALTGCADLDLEPAEVPANCSDCEPWGLDEPDEIAQAPGDGFIPNRPELPAEELAYCLPRPLAYTGQGLPVLPEEVLGQCGLDTVEYSSRGQLQTVTRYSRLGVDQIEAVETYPGHQGQDALRRVFTLGEHDQVLEIHEVREFTFPNSSGGHESLWRFDQAGRLLVEEIARVSGRYRYHSSVVQEWEEDRLVSRLEHRQVNDYPRVEVHYQWRYDDRGRLVEGHATHSGESEDPRLHQVEWTYDTANRPLAVTRTSDDRVTLQQGWSWEGDELRERVTSVQPEFFVHEWQASDRPAHELDDHMPIYAQPGVYGGMRFPDSDFWASSLTREVGGCLRLPTSLAHGYPDAEPEYRLGWALDERPSNVGQIYGDTGYAWMYGRSAWFGHGGALSWWPGIFIGYGPHGDGRFEVRVGYDEQGRMVEEDIELMNIVEEEIEPFLSVQRRRTFDLAMLTDELTVVGAEETIAHRTLRFERDEQGRILQRDLLDGPENRLIAYQTWEHDSHHVVTHESFGHHAQRDPYYFYDSGPLDFEEFDGSPTWMGTMSRRIEADGGAAEESLTSENGRGELTQTLRSQRFDERGLLNEVSILDLNERRLLRRESFDYDERRRLTYHGIDTNGDGHVDQSSHLSYDDSGRLLRDAFTSRNYSHAEARRYQC